MFALLSAVMVRSVDAGPVGAYVYDTTSSNQFGVLNLTNGVFTQTTVTTPNLYGFGEVGNTLYSASGSTFYSVNAVTGGLTSIGTSAFTYDAVGSAGSTVYGLDTSSNLYSINTSTGAGTLISGTSINIANGYNFSNGSSTLYLAQGSELYSVNTTTGAFTDIGPTGVTGTESYSGFDGLVYQNGVLYGDFSNFDGSADTLYSINTSTGAASFIATVTGATGYSEGLAQTPEPGNLGLSAFTLAVLLVGSAAYRRRRAPKTIG
jgi:hypothetical protein